MMNNLLSASAPEPLVRFKAGKCETEPRPNGKVYVKPTPRRGEIQLVKQDDLLHFQWRDRVTLAVDPTCDHMVFPGDAKFNKVETGRDGDRVYALQFGQNTSRNFFFWMQSKEDDDAAVVGRLNAAMNGQSGSMANVLRRLQNQPTPQDAPITLEGLQNVMQNLGMPAAQRPAQPGTDAPGVVTETLQRPPLSLDAVLPPDALADLLSDPAVVERLVPHLPEGQRTPDELRAIARQPQFRQALTHLDSALRSADNFSSIFASFDIPPSTAPTSDPVHAFLNAIQAAFGAAPKDDDDDAEMQDAPPPDDD